MKKNLILALTVLMMIPSAMFATEGMWVVAMLNKINEAEMQGLGLKLSKDDIYNINQASLKDAIVRFGAGFCTGEIVSDKGLVFTNHHCAYDAIQSSSTLENNILQTTGSAGESIAAGVAFTLPGFLFLSSPFKCN